MSAAPSSLEVLPGLSAVPQADWDGLLQPGDAPLLSWAYLQGLEHTGCVGDGTSWQPAHLALRDGRGALLAAAPAYIKTDSDGEWVYDQDWAQFAGDLGVRYYPKLVLGLPYNPVTGRRLLTPPGLPEHETARRQAALLRGAGLLMQQAGLSSLHVHFIDPAELAACRRAGLLVRCQEQYHFLNPGYGAFDDFLARLTAHRRHSVRRERRALSAAGITVTTHPGCERDGGFCRADLDRVFDMYVATSVRYTGGPPFLSRDFFHLCADRLGDRLELVLARRGGQLLAGAWNLRSDLRLYGRYWGEAEHVPFLHFEVCFYHSMERAIALRLSAFEPGHGGEQKLLRGFQPVMTYSAHDFRKPEFRRVVARFLKYEEPYVLSALKDASVRCPLRPDPPRPSDPATAGPAKDSL